MRRPNSQTSEPEFFPTPQTLGPAFTSQTALGHKWSLPAFPVSTISSLVSPGEVFLLSFFLDLCWWCGSHGRDFSWPGLSPPRAGCRATGIPGKGKEGGEERQTSLMKSCWDKCQGIHRDVGVQALSGGNTALRASLAHLDLLRALWYCLGFSSDRAGDHIPLHCFNLLHETTYPQIFVSKPNLGSKLQTSVSNGAPTSVCSRWSLFFTPNTVQTRFTIFYLCLFPPVFLIPFCLVWNQVPDLGISPCPPSPNRPYFFPTIAPCVQDLHPPHLFTSHLPEAKLEPPTEPPPPASSDHRSPSPTTRANSWKHGTASSHFPAPKPAMPAPPPMHTALSAAVVGGTQWGTSSRAFKGRCWLRVIY